MRGATKKRFKIVAGLCSFNSRTPCGVRRRGKTFDELSERVSIHAPRAGCDDAEHDVLVSRLRFQFTHPVRGATAFRLPRGTLSSCFNSRTPCGVRHRAAGGTRRKIQSFNSRTPCGVRRYPRVGGQGWDQVSIHAPRAGCDPCPSRFVFLSSMFQFTHPVRGATAKYLLTKTITISFNSRTPCGVRRLHFAVGAAGDSFNSRTPCGVRQSCKEPGIYYLGFNSRTPCGVRLPRP